jgi:hypothetical protein
LKIRDQNVSESGFNSVLRREDGETLCWDP